jgi:hypothetical protein
MFALLIRWRWSLTLNDYWIRLRFSFAGFKWFDVTLLVFLGLILSCFLFVGFTTPPNNMDSLDPTGITRIFYWMQQGTMEFGKPNGISSIFDPLYFHIQGVWLYSLGRSEYLFFLVQWFSLVVSTATVFRISRSLGFSTISSLLSSMVGLSLPVVLMQTYSFQGDLTVAVLVLVCISFMMDWIQSKNKLDLIFAGFALFFALGTKKAAFLAIPVFFVWIVFWLISRLKNKRLIPWGIGSTMVILVSVFILVGHSVIRQGGTIAGVQIIFDKTLSEGGVIEKYKYNAPRFLYQLIGLDGLPRILQNSLIQVKAKYFQKTLVPSSLDLEKKVFLQPGFDQVEEFNYREPLILSEESAWFGPIGVLLIPAAILSSLFSKQRNRRIYGVFSFTLFLSFFIMVIIQRPGWDPYQGRYFILPVLPMVPLVSMLIPSKRIWRAIMITFFLPICLFLSFNTYFANNSRPVITAGTIWGFQYQYILNLPENNKYELYIKNKLITSTDQIATAALDRPTIYQSSYWEQVYYSGYRMLQNIQFVDSLVPDGVTLYIDFPSSAFDYGLFGKNKDRELIRVNNASQVSSGYYLTKTDIEVNCSSDADLLGDNGLYKIYMIN